MSIARNVLETIGNTPLVRLENVVPQDRARVLVKLEGANPGGSMKDRMALSMITAAEKEGHLSPGGTIVEYTGGSTGTSLALVCAAKGYRLRIVTSDAFSQEKLGHMRALGAELIIVPGESGRIEKMIFERIVEKAREISQESGAYWTDQFNNPDNFAGYYPLGDEIWSQTGGRVDAFVQSVGTGASLRGTAMALRHYNPDLYVAAVEPATSPVLAGGAPGVHHIEGIGVGFIPPLWDPNLVNEIVAVSSDEAKTMARRLAREEALFAGTSSGANVVAAIRVAERLGPEATVVTLLVDSGLKYLSSGIYQAA